MSRALSSAARESLTAAETERVWLLLLTIAHPSLPEPIRVVNNPKDIVSRGGTYLAFPFEIDLPEDTANSLPRMSLTIDNVDRRIVEAVRSITSPASVSLEVVLADQPDMVEIGFDNLVLRQVEYDALTVRGDLEWENVLNEPFPAPQYLPGDWPGLF